MTALQKIHTKKLSQEEIEALYPYANNGREYYVNPNSPAFVDKIIELWFRTQGYDFWNNPYPEVTEWACGTKEMFIEFTYVTNE